MKSPLPVSKHCCPRFRKIPADGRESHRGHRGHRGPDAPLLPEHTPYDRDDPYAYRARRAAKRSGR
jgi:hypothetical protein